MADDIADAINTNGLKAIAEFSTIRDRLARQGSPEQVKALEKAVLGKVPKEEREKIEKLLQLSSATRKAEAPIAGMDGKTSADILKNRLKPQPETLSDKAAKISKGVFGPAHKQAVSLLDLANQVSIKADVQDMVDGSREATDAVKSGSGDKLMAGSAKMIGGLAGMAVPENFSGIKKGTADLLGKKGELPAKSVTKNPMTAEEFRKLPETGQLDPKRVRTMQDKISPSFKDKRTVKQMVDDLKSGKLKPDDIKPIAIAEIDGEDYTLDHRRLVAHRLAGVPVQFRKATGEELNSPFTKRKKTSKDNGMSIVIKRSKK